MIRGKENRRPLLFRPIEIRAHVRAFLAASLTGEAGLDVGQPNIIRPTVAVDRGPMAAPEIRATDHEAANA